MPQVDFRKLAEARRSELMKRQTEAMARWQPYIAVVEKFFKSQGRDLQEYQKANIAQCCDNLFDFYVLNKMGGMVSEATYSDAIAFARQMLPTIPALLPSLVADHVSIVQAIDRPQAQVYFMNIKAATTKGTVGVTDQLIGAKVGHAASADARSYASDEVIAEANLAGSPAQGRTLTACRFFPLIDLSVTVNGLTVTKGGSTRVVQFRSTTSLTLQAYYTVTTPFDTAWSGVVGTYTLGSGVIVLDAGGGGTIDAATTSTVNYRYDVERCDAGCAGYADRIGGLDLEVVSENVDARVFPLKLNYTVFAAINLQKIHGMVLADEGMKFATQEIRFAIDQTVLSQIKTTSRGAGSATGPGTFNCTVGAGQEWIWRIHELKRYMSKGSANIFAKTLRAIANVAVGGINVCSLIEQLPEYKPAAGIGTKPPAGPYVHGTLGNRLIICNPFYLADEYVELFRGDNYLFAGIIFAPYVPLYATDPVTLADLTTQRGFLSQAAIKVINPGMFCYGDISNY
jgi:hypothetical protein